MVLEIQDMAQHFVLTRSGRRESFDGDRICDRINALCEGLQVSAQLVTDRIINGLYDGITTKEIDQFSAMAAANLYLTHPDYTMLAGRILTSNLHRCTPDTFSEAMRVLLKEGILDVSFYKTVHRYKDILDEAIQQSRDFEYNFSGFNVIHSQYLLKDNKGNDVERVQYALMRIAVQIHGDAVDEVLKTYETLSKRHYIHASPVWYNAGTRRNQLQSCFVFDTDDTIEGIYDTLKDMALVGKHCGGIGVRLSRLRGDGSRIASIQGISQGILPLAKVIEASCKYVTQAGKRLGQANVFLDIFHPDIEHFAAAKILSKAANNDQHLNYLWTSICIPDLFMKRLSEAIETKCPQKWSLFQPHHHPQLYDCYGEAFEKLYLELEAADKACHTVDVETLFWTIIQSRSETGAPFIFFTDNVNRCSNQKNIGMIRSSNLCMEVRERHHLCRDWTVI
jgi:ribonucleoside-diphosphate reductase alpha chain